MSDQALQFSSVDNMLPLQGAAAGGPQGLAAHSPGGEGQFSSVLKGHVHAMAGHNTQNAEKPAQVARIDKATGSTSPQSGNSLPLQSMESVPVLITEVTALDLITGLPEMPLLPEVIQPELLADGLGDPAALTEQHIAGLNGLIPVDLGKPEPGMLRSDSQSADLARQLPANLAQQSFQQGKPGAGQLPLMQNPASTAAVDTKASVEELVPVMPATTRPLTTNERLLLERARSSATATPQGVAEMADKGLTRDVLSMAAMDARRAVLASANGGTTAALNDFKPVMEQLTNPVLPSSVGADENVYSQLMSGVQRSTGTASAQAMPVLNVATTVGQQGWSNEMSQRVSWMANTELREAQLQLNPRHLGPLEVRISFGQEQQLNVNFTVSNPMAREAVDAALPRLREMLEQQGMNLADASVSQESYAERQRQRNHEASDHHGVEHDGELSDMEITTDSSPPMQRLSEGMIDAYA